MSITPDIIQLLIIIAVAMVFFAFDWIPADIVAMGMVLVLLFTGILPPDKAFAGFASDTVMMIFGLFIMTAALLRTGVVDLVGRAIMRFGASKPEQILLYVLIAVSVISAFISNTAATAFFLPVVFGIVARTKESPSKYLLPLAFCSILTSSVTLVSTSTNIVVSDLIKQSGMEPIGMFELAPVGIPIAIIGFLYIWFIGRRLMPNRMVEDIEDQFGLRPYLTEILILPDSNFVDKTLAESRIGQDLDLAVLRVVRDKSHIVARRTLKLKANDRLLVQGSKENILRIKDIQGLEIKAEVDLKFSGEEGGETVMAEAILMPHSNLVGRNLREGRFRERYDLQVLAINRSGETIRSKLSQTTLKAGDVLLLQGNASSIKALEDGDMFNVLGAVSHDAVNYSKAPLTIVIFIFALLLATFKFATFPVAMIAGAFLVFITRCVTPEEAYHSLEWQALILIGFMLSLGVAMEQTGTAKYLAGLIVHAFGSADPLWLLGGFFVLTVALTQPMSNQAAAVVVVPIALQTASQIGVNPRTFAMMIAVAASCSYLTPLEPSCLMVYGPGRYRFADFIKIGAILTILIFIVAMLIVPLVWPLHLAAGPLH